MIRTLLLFVLSLLAAPATAATASSENQNYDSWYQIEIIVFKPRKPPVSDELWPDEDFNYPGNMVSISVGQTSDIKPYALSQLDSLTNAPEPAAEEKLEIQPTTVEFLFEGRGSHNRQLVESSSQSEVTAESSPDSSQEKSDSLLAEPSAEEAEPELDFAQASVLLDSILPKAFMELPGGSFNLVSIARSLRRSSKYDLAMHKAWLQPIGGKPTPILLQTGERYGDLFEIDGTMSISRSRYLHVQADLWFTQFEPKYSQSQFMRQQPENFSEIEKEYPELIKVEQNRDSHLAVQSFPLHHSRRIRRSELHFIDHPYFGILIQIEKFTYPGN